jgi:hypothetical protein
MFRAGLQVPVVHGSTRIGGDAMTTGEFVAEFIPNKANKQADVARVYAEKCREAETVFVDFSAIHTAIANRWSEGAIRRIKKMAWGAAYDAPL